MGMMENKNTLYSQLHQGLHYTATGEKTNVKTQSDIQKSWWAASGQSCTEEEQDLFAPRFDWDDV